MNPINRKYFFDRVRHALFGGKLEMWQVDGLTRILDYREAKWPNMWDEELAYVLATVKWETGHTMQPIQERGSTAYLRSKPYWPWIGGGLVMLTWDYNYKKFGVASVRDACAWPVALDVLFRGMIFGMFTGRKLAHFIDRSAHLRDYVNARRIINGTDKAALIAGFAEAFLDALTQARQRPADAPRAA